jgi:hypothetical protein
VSRSVPWVRSDDRSMRRPGPCVCRLPDPRDAGDCSLQDDAILPGIVERLGGPYFALIASGIGLGMQFDGDGTYTILGDSVKLVRG